MERLRSGDLHALAEVVADIGELNDLDEFRSLVLTQMRRVVSCDVAAYNEVGPAHRLVVLADPPDSLLHDTVDAFGAHAHENPLLAFHASDPHGTAARLSDFISAPDLHRLDLYDLVYRPLSVEHQLAVAIPGADRMIGITVSRGGRDFDDSELAMLEAVRPFLVAALRNIHARRRVDATLAALARASAAPAAILLLSDCRGLEPADERSERWLGAASSQRAQLMQELELWARRPAGAEGHAPLVISEPRRAEHLGGPHLARFIPGSAAHPGAILVEPARRPARAADLLGLGLTPRQCEVLLLAKAGLTNDQIAFELGLSPRTVAHHLEQIYSRLGVSKRTAAINRVDHHLAGSGMA